MMTKKTTSKDPFVSSAFDFTADVKTLKGIGEKTALVLKKAGIKTVRDFFYNLPRDYENFSTPLSIAEIRPGKVAVKGQIDNLSTRRARKRNLTITEGMIKDKTGAIRTVWFNQSYRARQFEPGREYLFTGVYELKNGRYQLTSPAAALVSDIDTGSGLAPVYVAHGGLKSNDFRRLLNNSRDKFTLIPDLLPSVKEGTRKEALFYAHFPISEKSVKGARDYLAYEELFTLILAAKLNQRANEKLKSLSVPLNIEKIREFITKLPFKPTNAQRKATWEIVQNLEKSTPMNRLLQGDVGSGKTLVAAISAYETILAGFQVALLAPTAILAAQHFETLSRFLSPFGVKTTLLTGATKQKTPLKAKIKVGKIDLIVGTHALLTDDTEFSKLALVIIDEQHRFGVEQRQKLMLKSPEGSAPHLLAMTATPIPRSLQLTVFGDLDVSILNELPRGRQPVATRILPEIAMRTELYPEIEATLSRHEQIYWICRAIENQTDQESTALSSDNKGGKNASAVSVSERKGHASAVNHSEKLGNQKPEQANISEATSVKTRAKKLRELFPRAKIEYLHGKMKPAEKDDVMSRFENGEIEILVSTTVVEVGVDVPNATLMIIENSESYGLAQLHQLRGRVGRGQTKSSCFLLTSGDNPPTRRLKELEKSNDGFHLAEVDLKLRGPGEIYGSLQHGALDLRIASLSDTRLIARAQKDVATFLQNPENLLKYKELMQSITRYQQLTTLN